jgi:hypothetical protein
VVTTVIFDSCGGHSPTVAQTWMQQNNQRVKTIIGRVAMALMMLQKVLNSVVTAEVKSSQNHLSDGPSNLGLTGQKNSDEERGETSWCDLKRKSHSRAQ